MNKKPLIILTGPTASGKSSLAIRLARQIGGEIISADSMQVYRGMDIGTAKIRPEEMQGIPHYLIDVMDPDEPFNVVVFQALAKEAMAKIRAAGHIPIIAGGTGFYIQALFRDIDFTENDNDISYRKHLEALAGSAGPEALFRMLLQEDPESAAAIHPNNIKKVIRALEFKHQTGQKISDHNREQAAQTSPYQYAYFVLNMDRAILYEKIEQRVDEMMSAGLLQEVERLRSRGYGMDLVSMQGLGYKEIYAYLEGECSLEEAVSRIKLGTRHFAKRQLTWFRREKDVIWLEKRPDSSEEELTEFMINVMKEKNIL